MIPHMFLDRSLAAMTAIVCLMAIISVSLAIASFQTYLTRKAEGKNQFSTSVGEKIEPCASVEFKSTIIHIFINIGATIILGVSNTYQQLATGLSADELRKALESGGAVTVGTNSPFSIRHKQTGKVAAYFSWAFLLATSLPVHLLANSAIGPSFVLKPGVVEYEFQPQVETYQTITGYIESDAQCWFAFIEGSHNGSIAWSSWLDIQVFDFDSEYDAWKPVNIRAAEECQKLAKTDPAKGNASSWFSGDRNFSRLPDCAKKLECSLLSNSERLNCRLTVRVSAALVLAASVAAKAIYLVVVGLRARNKKKSICVSLGDVVVASVVDRSLKLGNQCMANAESIHRRRVEHTCHKHCKNKTPDPSGDGLGHCQHCKKFNSTNHASDLENPAVANKFKHSLISVLGGASVVQMLILWACSCLMLAVSGHSAAEGIKRQIDLNRCDQSDPGFCAEDRVRLRPFRQAGLGGFDSTISFTALNPGVVTS